VVAHATDVIDLPSPLAALSGGDAALDQQLQRAARLAETEVSVLVTGETGSGKEYLARALHAASPRRDQPFVAVNCAAIPETLIESELFGHLPGAFSGAAPKGKRGLVQEADGGTLFLDEIGDMPLAMQARLLRVLAEREVLPIGATRAIKVDVRVLAATHADLPARVREGRFREDLYYRLAGAHLTLPPLRRRRDLGWLIGRFLGTRADARQLDPAAEQRLLAYAWPGNLRELRNALDFARAMAGPGGVIGLPELPESVLAATSAAALEDLAPTAGSGDRASPIGSQPSPEAMLLLQYLRAARWNISAVAHQMGLSRMTVYRRMHRWGIRPPT
jgi:transcriptional regulator of acetoin/glycerol metabolism